MSAKLQTIAAVQSFMASYKEQVEAFVRHHQMRIGILNRLPGKETGSLTELWACIMGTLNIPDARACLTQQGDLQFDLRYQSVTGPAVAHYETTERAAYLARITPVEPLSASFHLRFEIEDITDEGIDKSVEHLFLSCNCETGEMSIGVSYSDAVPEIVPFTGQDITPVLEKWFAQVARSYAPVAGPQSKRQPV